MRLLIRELKIINPKLYPAMRLFLIILIFLPAWAFAQKQDGFDIYSQTTESGFTVYADNDNPYPLSLKISFELKNLKNNQADSTIYILPAKTKRMLITELLKIHPNESFSMSYSIQYNRGNHLQKTYDSNFVYHLPYDSGKTFQVDQGYNGVFSHQNEKAIDFSMPIGTPIRAIRGGVVASVVQKHNSGCPSSSCQSFNNAVHIYHSDGTFAEYLHLKHNGVTVAIGDTVVQGQLIAYSGNTGWTSGPHLHLMVYFQRLNGVESVPTKFLTSEVKPAIYLKEREKYKRDY